MATFTNKMDLLHFGDACGYGHVYKQQTNWIYGILGMLLVLVIWPRLQTKWIYGILGMLLVLTASWIW